MAWQDWEGLRTGSRLFGWVLVRTDLVVVGLAGTREPPYLSERMHLSSDANDGVEDIPPSATRAISKAFSHYQPRTSCPRDHFGRNNLCTFAIPTRRLAPHLHNLVPHPHPLTWDKRQRDGTPDLSLGDATI